ncbi:MAG: helix-turn-helix domain-containing protein [Heliobacteriaceae bacterium]|jgi:DNA-binding XRE family transcriptional regulator|nr:helix-turn-helix domain-containing protein [Heliobacteriaceae bacterium]
MSKVICKNFGKNLRKLRLERGLTQEELGFEIDIDNSTIAKYEKNKRCPNLLAAKKIADFFEVTIDKMLKN